MNSGRLITIWIFALNVGFWNWARYALAVERCRLNMINELWSDEKIALLKELWALDLTAAKISEIMTQRRMPAPKNAIYKKAQRLGLTPRASPIIKIAPEKSRKIMIKESHSAPEPSDPPIVLEKFSTNSNFQLSNSASKYERGDGCCWPIGDPKKDDFRFCGKKRIARNYCAFHDRIAYQRPLQCA